MMLIEARDDFMEGCSVRVVRLERPPRNATIEELGVRRRNATGIVIDASVPGFDSGAIRVKLLEPFGEQNGEEGIYFPGECERIPDILIHP